MLVTRGGQTTHRTCKVGWAEGTVEPVLWNGLLICLEDEESGDYDEDDRYENEPLRRRHEFVAAVGTDTDVEIHVLLTGWADFHRDNLFLRDCGCQR